MILQTCTSYEDAVKRAVALGNDTDTTACITGGLAGIRYGYEHIPQRWINQLRETDLVDQLLLRLQSA
ncbi:ADP-ribosylglycohydrolase [compost metagenome]